MLLIYTLTYLDDEVLESGLVLGGVLVEVGRETAYREHFEVFNAFIALLHLLQSGLVVQARHHFTVLDLLVSHSLFVSLLKHMQVFLVDALALSLTVALSHDLDFEGFLVGVLAHHALQFEGVSVQLHLSTRSL